MRDGGKSDNSIEWRHLLPLPIASNTAADNDHALRHIQTGSRATSQTRTRLAFRSMRNRFFRKLPNATATGVKDVNTELEPPTA